LTTPTEPFDELLDWLDSDREAAGKKYETIRAGLIRLFISHGLSDAEYYADETIDRVVKRLPEIRPTYVGEPGAYFRGVARYVLLEAVRKKEVAVDFLPDSVIEQSRTSDMADCLRECLGQLSQDKRELILDYHVHEGEAKIELHTQMAAELSISKGALRTRAHHVRSYLEECVLNCVAERDRNKTPVHRHN
jgi:DNA-directed RNA polymerase specialized sigma24 family protein